MIRFQRVHSLPAIQTRPIDGTERLIYLIELYENILGMPGLKAVTAFLLHTCNKTMEIMSNSSRSCCGYAGRSCKLIATSPQGGVWIRGCRKHVM